MTMMMLMRRCFLIMALMVILPSPGKCFAFHWSLSATSTLVQRRHTNKGAEQTVTRRNLPSSSWLVLPMTATNENTQRRRQQPQKGKQQQQQEQQQQPEQRQQGYNNNGNNNNYILQDASGHVNGELAERIWNWEQELRQKRKLPQVDYSIRTGLRLVDQAVQEFIILQQQRDNNDNDYNTNNNNENNDSIQNNALYADLIQEGLSALLDAMSRYRADHYNQQDDENDTSKKPSKQQEADFETYALNEIRTHLAFVLNQEEQDSHRQPSPPLPRLPQTIRNVLKQAKQVAAALTRENGQQKPITLQAVAERLDGGMPVEQLRDYLRLARLSSRRRSRRSRSRRYSTPLSMESTVKISSSIQDSSPTYTDQEEWELQQGLFLNDGHTLHRDELIDEFLDEMIEYEGDDEAWIRQQAQIAGPLQDLIPDDSTIIDDNDESSSSSPDDLALSEMIRHDVREFLTTTLNDDEHRVIRLVFGLDNGGRQLSLKKTAHEMGMSSTIEVSNLLQMAIQKLRESYTKKYASDPNLDNDNDDEFEYGDTVDSV